MSGSNALDDLLPIREIDLAGSKQPFASKLDFAAGFTTSTTTDSDTGAQTIHVTAGSASVHSGSSGATPGMNDANFAVTETSGETYVGSGTQFTADRTLTLPASPGKGQKVTWADECTTAGGSLLNHNLIVNGNGAQVQSGGTDQTGGITNASTYTATKNAWPPGSTITLLFNGTLWKVI